MVRILWSTLIVISTQTSNVCRVLYRGVILSTFRFIHALIGSNKVSCVFSAVNSNVAHTFLSV